MGEQPLTPFHGRGASENPANRFEKLAVTFDEDPQLDPNDRPAPTTQFFRDETRSILSYNDSPDVGFSASINPYRGCEHGCIYCYARPTHEYLGFSAGLDFESRIFVKEDAPELLWKELSAKSWKPQTIAMSGVTDPYQPAERHFRLTRRCLEVLAQFRNPVGIVTKNILVTRDIDVLQELARFHAVAVFVSVTSLRGQLQRIMEPRTADPKARLLVIQKLADAGIPVGVMVAPVIPGLTDHEVPAIVRAATNAGARFAGSVPVRLPYAVKGLFERWLSQHFPTRKEKILNRIRSMRGGKLNNSEFGSRMRGEGQYAELLKRLVRVSRTRTGIEKHQLQLSTAAFRRPRKGQPSLF